MSNIIHDPYANRWSQPESEDAPLFLEEVELLDTEQLEDEVDKVAERGID